MRIVVTLDSNDVHWAIMEHLKKNEELAKIEFFIRTIEAPQPRKDDAPSVALSCEIELGIPF